MRTFTDNVKRMAGKARQVLSLLAVVSMVLVSSGQVFAQDTSSTHDRHTVVADMCVDMGADLDGGHAGGHMPAGAACDVQVCPYCFPVEEAYATVFQRESVDYAHMLKRWLSVETLPFKRPPRFII